MIIYISVQIIFSDDLQKHRIRYKYDKLGNIIERWIKIDGISEKRIYHKYDPIGREIEITYPSPSTRIIVKEYDNLGRLKYISEL
jgi:YD repeat-containing protein